VQAAGIGRPAALAADAGPEDAEELFDRPAPPAPSEDMSIRS